MRFPGNFLKLLFHEISIACAQIFVHTVPLVLLCDFHFNFSDRDYEDKPFEEEDLPTGFDSDHSEDDDDDNNWSDWRGNLSGI